MKDKIGKRVQIIRGDDFVEHLRSNHVGTTGVVVDKCDELHCHVIKMDGTDQTYQTYYVD